MQNVLMAQYDLVRRTRETLFTFLETMPIETLHVEVPGFGFGTIASTHLHVAGCYAHWLVTFARIRERAEFPSVDEIRSADVAVLRDWFAKSDVIVDEFLHAYDERLTDPIYNQDEMPVALTPLWLMSHTMTHEFHHKGQIVTMARHLGFTPPDTDLVLP